MGPRAGLDGRKISSLPGFDPSSSVAIPTELPGPRSRPAVSDNAACFVSSDGFGIKSPDLRTFSVLY